MIVLRYGEARLLLKSTPYDAKMQRGEQRGTVGSHARKLRKEMEAGTYTPTPVTAGVRPRNVTYVEHTATVDVSPEKPAALTDGGHRFQALEDIRVDAERRMMAAKTDEDRAAAKAYLDLVDRQPIVATVFLDGNTQDDFVNLQKGKAVDPTHLLSLRATVTCKRTGAFSVVFSRDGKFLASANVQYAQLWDVATGRNLGTFAKHPGPVTALALSPEGKVVATAWMEPGRGNDGKGFVRLTEASTGKVLADLKGHILSIGSLAFSPDGRLLASGSNDRLTVQRYGILTKDR